MQIKMKALMAGPNVLRQPGKVYDVPDAEAKELIAGDYAEKYVAPKRESAPADKGPETADANAPENAADAQASRKPGRGGKRAPGDRDSA